MVMTVDTATLPAAFNDSMVAALVAAIADLCSTVAAAAESARANITIDFELA